MKAVLRPTESEGMRATCPFPPYYQIDIKHGEKYNFMYDSNDDFYIIVDGRIYEETSTAFDFLND